MVGVGRDVGRGRGLREGSGPGMERLARRLCPPVPGLEGEGSGLGLGARGLHGIGTQEGIRQGAGSEQVQLGP